MTAKMPIPGQRFRHFKGGVYQVVTLATHTETEEKLVVYQALYGDFRIYARPLEQFLSEVDRDKYPEASQKYRFEPMEEEVLQKASETNKAEEISKQGDAGSEKEAAEKTNEDPAKKVKPEGKRPENEQEAIMYFLDMDTYAEKWNALSVVHEFLSDRMIDTLAAALDIVIPEGDLEERFSQLRICINTKRRYEINR